MVGIDCIRPFRERGIEESILLELNLIRKNDKGQAYDFFRNRGHVSNHGR